MYVIFHLTTRIHYAMLQGTSVCPDLQSPSGLQNRDMAESITGTSLSQESTQVTLAELTVSTCLSTVPSPKNTGFLASTRIRSK